ncbi:hypothetical protein ACFL01_04700, partial [Planctomycetota bacterium]
LYVKNTVSLEETGEGIASVTAGTMSVALVQGRVLFLYAFANYTDDADLQWTRDLSEKWVHAVLDANTGQATTSSAEGASHLGRSSFDWSKIMYKALAGLVLGAVVVVVLWLREKVRSSAKPKDENADG